MILITCVEIQLFWKKAGKTSLKLFFVPNLHKKGVIMDHAQDREVSQIWNFFKIIWFLHHLKALNERISKWAYFLNLTKRFRSVCQKRGFFQARLRGNLHIWNGTKKKNFDGLFYHFLGKNTHNFVKSDVKFENKCLFHAKFYEAWHEKIFGSQSCEI